jgi:hypothetical protein
MWQPSLVSQLARNYSRTSAAAAKDIGDIIGIDLGTTNSCVAIMEVRCP